MKTLEQQPEIAAGLAVSPSGSRPLASAIWLSVTLLLGAVQAWLRRHEMGADGVSYRDMAAGLFDGRWPSLLNGCWSPGYPASLAVGMGLISNEQLAVKIVNYLLFVCASLAFAWLVEKLPFSRTGISIAWMCWLFVSLSQMGNYRESPDFGVAAFVFLTAGLVLESTRGEACRPVLLGVVLAGGYLFKAAFLPEALVALAFVFWTNRRAAGISAACCVLVAAPYVIALSSYKGRPTIGDNGWYNWATHVQRIPIPIWHGDQLNGSPKHPIEQISGSPEVDVFRGPFRYATYPPHYDPTYWTEGVRMRYTVSLFFDSVRRNLSAYVSALKQKVPITFFLLLLCLAAIGKFRLNRTGLVLLVIGITGTLLFLPVHMEPRYIGAYLSLVAVGLLSGFNVPERYFKLAAVLFGFVVAYQLEISLIQLRNSDDTNVQFARMLTDNGVRPGDDIAVVGDAHRSTWARALKLHIVAQVPDRNLLRQHDSELALIASLLEKDCAVTAVIGQFEDSPSIVRIARPRVSRSSRGE